MSAPTTGLEQLPGWLDDNWDPNLSVGQWWERLASSGWGAPNWPTGVHGLGLAPSEAAKAFALLLDYGALAPPSGAGRLLAGPTIYTHGTVKQIDRYAFDALSGGTAWCQLFSEPGAGSDLAGLQTRAERDGDVWRINGQKVWTTEGQYADLGICLARTDIEVPKHRGITYFVVDMHQAGIDVLPLREMTGRSHFNEVFLTDVIVSNDDIIGGPGNGWAVAKTTLAFERTGLGAGLSMTGASDAMPGTVAGHLARRAGDYVRRIVSGAAYQVEVEAIIGLARRTGRAGSPVMRQRLAALWIEHELRRIVGLRDKSLRDVGSELPGMGNINKLRMSEIAHSTRELGLDLLGPKAMLFDYEGRPAANEDEVLTNAVTRAALFSPAPSIYAGTDQIQRNLLAETVLGLPREALDERDTPFKQLRHNA